MKKLILFAAILFAGVSVANAQKNAKPDYQRIGHQSVKQGTKGTASTKLTVQLNSIQSISVNTSNVSLVYTTVEDYTNGVSSGPIADHLEVYSTGAYKVNVGYENAEDASYGATAAGSLGAEEMFQTINVAITQTADANSNATKLQPLSTNNGAIISSDLGVFAGKFEVEYQGQGGKEYIHSIKGNNPRTYTANVVYTITPN